MMSALPLLNTLLVLLFNNNVETGGSILFKFLIACNSFVCSPRRDSRSFLPVEDLSLVLFLSPYLGSRGPPLRLSLYDATSAAPEYNGPSPSICFPSPGTFLSSWALKRHLAGSCQAHIIEVIFATPVSSSECVGCSHCRCEGGCSLGRLGVAL